MRFLLIIIIIIIIFIKSGHTTVLFSICLLLNI